MTEPFVPKLWADEIMRTFVEGATGLGPPRMIEQKKLDALIRESVDVEGVRDIHDALKELKWRRHQMEKMQKKIQQGGDTVKINKPERPLAEHMRRLKFW